MAKSFTISAIFEAIDKISGPAKRIRVGLKNLKATVGRVGGALKGLTKTAGIMTAGIAAAGAGALRFAESFASAGDNVAKTARSLGLGVEAFQEWRFAADRSGVSGAVFESSVQALTKRVGEAKAGVGALTTFLKKSNPQLLRQIKATTSSEEAFELYINALAAIEDPAERAAAAAAAFGRSGLRMANLAAEGAAGIAKLRQEARDLGLVLSKEATKDGEEFTDSMTNLRAALSGVRNLIGARLLPVLKPLIEQFTRFLSSKRVQIAEAFSKAFDAIGQAIEQINWGELWQGINSTIASIRSGVEAIGGWKVALAGLGAILAGPLVLALGSVIAAVAKLGVVLLANPVGLLVAAIAGGAALIITHWEPIRDFFVDLWSDITDIFDRSASFITDKLAKITSPIRSARNLVSGIGRSLGFGGPEPAPAAATAPATSLLSGANRTETDITINFEGMPPGVRATTQPTKGPGTVSSKIGRRSTGLVGAMS